MQEVEADVTGTIPDWLTGILVMNGGGDYAPMKHLFDGYAMLSKVQQAPEYLLGDAKIQLPVVHTNTPVCPAVAVQLSQSTHCLHTLVVHTSSCWASVCTTDCTRPCI